MKKIEAQDINILQKDMYYAYLVAIQYPNLPDIGRKISAQDIQDSLVILRGKYPNKQQEIVKLLNLLEQTDELLKNYQSISMDELNQTYKSIMDKYINLHSRISIGFTNLTFSREISGILGIQQRYKANGVYEKQSFFFDVMRKITEKAGKKWKNPNAAVEMNIKIIEKELNFFDKIWIQNRIKVYLNDLDSLKERCTYKIQVELEQSIDSSNTIVVRPKYEFQFNEKEWIDKSRDLDRKIKDLELALLPTIEGAKKLKKLLPYNTADKARILIRLLRNNKQLIKDIIESSNNN